MRTTVRLLIILMHALLLLSLGMAARAASNASCDKSSVLVVWEGSDWTTTEKDTAFAGFEVWEWDADKYNGNAPVGISTSTGSQTVYVDWTSLTSGYGSGNCNTGQIVFNSSYRNEINSNATAFKGLAAHEMGHAIGIDHVHKYDSSGGDNPPVMWACGWGNDYRLTQDDNAAMQLQTDVASGWRSTTANSSFEEDGGYLEYWGITSGSTTSRGAYGVDGTPYHLLFKHSSTEPYIFSTTRLIDDPTIDWVKARANYQKYSSTDTGTVKITLRVRDYEVNGTGCGFPSRRDGSSPTYTAARYYTTTCTPTTSWNYCTTSGENPPDQWAERGGVEVRIYVYNRMFDSSGARTYVRVDRVRVLADY